MKQKIPEALRLKLSKAGKKGWRAKVKKYQGRVQNSFLKEQSIKIK